MRDTWQSLGDVVGRVVAARLVTLTRGGDQRADSHAAAAKLPATLKAGANQHRREDRPAQSGAAFVPLYPRAASDEIGESASLVDSNTALERRHGS